MLLNFKSLIELNDYFATEKTCYEFLANKIWEGGKPVCPHCGSTHIYTTKTRSIKPSRKDVPEYRCADKKCTKKFSTITGTIFESTKVPLRTWYAAIYLITTHKKGISSLQLATDLNITQKTAWFMNHRIREMYRDSAPSMLKDVVQIDEVHVGGLNKNRHADKKHLNVKGGAGKALVFGAIDLSGKVKTIVIPNTEIDTILPIVEKWVEKGSMMVTDEARQYHSSLDKDYFHVPIRHGDKQYVSGCFTTNNIENFWSLFQRGIIGIYHFVSPKHLERYSKEFEYRFNQRKTPTNERFEDVIKGVLSKRLKYADLIK